MTDAQQKTISAIRAAGYACKKGQSWYAASFNAEQTCYIAQGERPLPARIMNAFLQDGTIQRAPGRGYGNLSFWELKEER